MKQSIYYPVKYYRKQILCTVIFSLLAISMIAFCASEADVKGATGMVKAIFGLIDDIFGISKMDDLKNLLIIDFSGSTLKAGGITFTNLTTVITTMHKTFQNLAVIMLIIFFGVGIFGKHFFSTDVHRKDGQTVYVSVYWHCPDIEIHGFGIWHRKCIFSTDTEDCQ